MQEQLYVQSGFCMTHSTVQRHFAWRCNTSYPASAVPHQCSFSSWLLFLLSLWYTSRTWLPGPTFCFVSEQEPAASLLALGVLLFLLLFLRFWLLGVSGDWFIARLWGWMWNVLQCTTVIDMLALSLSGLFSNLVGRSEICLPRALLLQHSRLSVRYVWIVSL